MYTGRVQMYNGRTGMVYPFSHVDIFPEFDCKLSPSHTWLTTYFQVAATKSLVLRNLIGEYAVSNLDTSKKYIFSVLDNKLDINANYSYNGLRLAPISFEKSVTIDGVDKLITATFYKLK
jgi:hypothetical protein